MNNYTELESFDVLIKALTEYIDDINSNKNILLNAANVCDAALGNDDNAKKYINKLSEALVELDKTSHMTEEIVSLLDDERRRIIDIYES